MASAACRADSLGLALMPFPGLRIFIVEDEALIALMLHDMLADLNARVVGTATTRSTALQMIEAGHENIDVVTLDLNLGGETGHDVAALLSRLGIPFVLTTGYDEPRIFVGLEHCPVINKPFVLADLERALHAIAIGR
jgi:CheY-like chemotaxis protein